VLPPTRKRKSGRSDATAPPFRWPRFLWRFAAAMTALLVPWPGLAGAFAGSFADVCNACASVATSASGIQADLRFVADHYPEHPWWVQLAGKNVFTTQSFDIPVDTRTVAYIRIAVFLALAAAWPLAWSGRAARAAAVGLGSLLVLVGISILLATLQALALVKVIALGALVQSLISIGILSLVTYPSMAFAVPGLFWWFSLHLATRDRKDRTEAKPSPTAGRIAERPGSTR
jgi:hypothetical protein